MWKIVRFRSDERLANHRRAISLSQPQVVPSFTPSTATPNAHSGLSVVKLSVHKPWNIPA